MDTQYRADTDASTAKYVSHPTRHVELDIDIGADAKDWSAIQATEKLKPVETELRRIEEMVTEIVGEMDYLRIREQKLRDTNESTNTRVKWFGFATTFLLIGLWGWQIMYLRAYFRWVPQPTLFRGPLLTEMAAGRSILFKVDDEVDRLSITLWDGWLSGRSFCDSCMEVFRITQRWRAWFTKGYLWLYCTGLYMATKKSAWTNRQWRCVFKCGKCLFWWRA